MAAADPTLKPANSDNEYQSFYKIVDILNQLVPSLDLQPANTDVSTGSLQKINALLWQMLDAPWSDCPLQNGWTGSLQARVSISSIEFQGTISSSVPLGITALLVATLPPSILPEADRHFMAPGGTSANPICLVALIIDAAAGQLRAAAFNANDNPTYIWFDGVSVSL